ncbi:energy-coupling factor transporter transmembrane component T [Corynebacterium diphtheriae]
MDAHCRSRGTFPRLRHGGRCTAIRTHLRGARRLSCGGGTGPARAHIIVDVCATWFAGLSLILPGITCCWYLLRTVSASEFMAAMQRMRSPDALTIPTSIMFRFFPTILEEYRDIRTAMQMRGISGLRNPIAMLEYRFVPLLASVVSIGNELAMSAVTRGLGSPRRRTTLCEIGFRVGDAIVISVLVVSLILLLVNIVMLP